MNRIDTDTKAVDLFGAGKHGFKDGDLPNGVIPTDFDAKWCNAVQEELMNVIEGAGIVPSHAVFTQVRQAIKRITGGNVTTVNAANSPFVLTPDHAGLVIMDATAGNISATLPLANVLAATRFFFVRPDTTASTASVSRAGADTIDGATSFSLAPGYDYRQTFATGGALWLTLATKPTDQSPVGMCASFAFNEALPAGWVKRNGAAYSRITYPVLYARLVKTSTATITIAAPGVVTWNGHGRSVHDPIKWQTTGALPTGLVVGTTYYVATTGLTTNTFQLAATPGGVAINTTGAQAGVHTAIHAPFGDGDGVTTFNVPDDRGEFERNWDDGRGVNANRPFGSAELDAMQGHRHFAGYNTAKGYTGGPTVGDYLAVDPVTSSPAVLQAITDGVNGTPRVAAETRPRSGGVKLAAIKAF